MVLSLWVVEDGSTLRLPCVVRLGTSGSIRAVPICLAVTRASSSTSALAGGHAEAVGASKTSATASRKPPSTAEAAVSPRTKAPCSTYPSSFGVSTVIVSDIGSTIQYSDTLLMFLLKARQPEVYDDGVRRELFKARMGELGDPDLESLDRDTGF